jgi:hypothetical protein
MLEDTAPMLPAPNRRAEKGQLQDLAVRINREHEATEIAVHAAQAAAHSAVTHAVNVGCLLLEAKEQVGHGSWEAWVKAHIAFSPRTAQVYMRIADAVAGGVLDPQHAADLSIRQILTRIRSSGIGHRRGGVAASGRSSRHRNGASKRLVAAWKEVRDGFVRLTRELHHSLELNPIDDRAREDLRRTVIETVTELWSLGRRGPL